MDVSITKRSPLAGGILMLLFSAYLAGVLNIFLIWAGIQDLDPQVWHLQSLPAYSIVFILGGFSALLLLRQNHFGLYGLIGAWVLTGTLYLLFGPPFPTTGVTFPTILLISAFFLLFLLAGHRFGRSHSGKDVE